MMHDVIKPEYAILLIMIPPAIIGAIFARNRGRNIPFWAVLSALFPIFLMVVYFKEPLLEVPGGFKRCTSCGEYIKWKSVSCKYCNAAQPLPP